jgi:hypothetical protein
LAKRHREILARLDQVGLNRYRITEKDVEKVERYICIIQEDFLKLGVETTWQNIAHFAGPYGTAILIHEVVEIRALEARRLRPLRRKMSSLRQLLAQHIDVHVMALYEEHRYLQEVINRLYGQTFEVATLVGANCIHGDLERFLESDIGVFILEDDLINEAGRILARLKDEVSDED